jgi:hypothetical protein
MVVFVPMKTSSRRAVLEKAFQGINIKDLAEALNTSTKYLYGLKYGKQVSAVRTLEIEKASEKLGKKIPRTVLRPDIFGNGL